MSNEVRLSVIIPVYGTEKYIDTCLVSALKATDGVNAEIIIVNDGTKDKAGLIAQRYVAEYPNRMVYLEKENGGLADTKNFGLRYARGEYITFLDSDDYIEPEMYREMLALADSESADCVVCDMIYDYVNNDNRSYQKCASGREDLFHSLIDNSLMASSCNKIMKKELLEGLQFPVGKNNEDIAVTPIALGRSKKLAYLPRGFYHYVMRTGSIQRSSFSKKRFAILDVCVMTLERAKDFSPERMEMLKGSLYLHQILAVAFYLIRREPLIKRYLFLRDYMKLVNEYFPDFFQNNEIHEYTTWGSKGLCIYRKISIWLVKNGMYFALCVFWSIVKPFVRE